MLTRKQTFSNFSLSLVFLLQFASYSQYWQSELFLHLRYSVITNIVYFIGAHCDHLSQISYYMHPISWLYLYLSCRRLELHYPQFPSEEDFTHRLLGTGDLKQHSEGGELMLLSRFSMEWPILQAGGLLLPKLVEFYQWLHTQLGMRSALGGGGWGRLRRREIRRMRMREKEGGREGRER